MKTQGTQFVLSALNRLASAVAFTFVASISAAQNPPVDGGLDVPRGLRINTEQASPGYVLFNPGLSDTTYLVNNDGQVVHTWTTDYATGHSVYLYDNGNLLRLGFLLDIPLHAGGQGGIIQLFNWENDLLWEYKLANDQYLQHHDLAVLPNGNLLTVAWEFKTAEEARAAGRRPDLLSEDGLWPGVVLELKPVGSDDAEIVWEWHAWDHFIQDFDPAAENYGTLSEHPELSDINSDTEEFDDAVPDAELHDLLTSGAVALVDAEEVSQAPDILHINGIAYNSDLDQLVVSIHDFHEFWVIDHSTTSEEAASSSGGRSGMGGDILYRWGNPSNYDRGGPQALYGQHHARWTEEGLPGAGRITVFNNNFVGADGSVYSTVVDIQPPIDADGSYVLSASGAYGPADPTWSYRAPKGSYFRSHFISGAHRLPNRHTFINSGAQGRFFEVTPEGEIVWEYWTPYSGTVGLPEDETLVRAGAQYPYATFRATRILPDHPGLTGRDLSPMNPQPPLVPHVVLPPLEEETEE